MSSGRLPSVRLGSLSEEDPTFHEIEVDFQPSSGSKFGFAWPGSPDGQRSDQSLRNEQNQNVFSANTASASEETDSTRTYDYSQEEAAPDPLNTQDDSSGGPETTSLPRLSRAFSMPLPSQIGHWQRPSRSPYGSGTPAATPSNEDPAAVDQGFQELALELADSVQMAVQTLLQLSPPHLFDPAKEQFSACAVQIPTPCITALLTSMKNLNYISANMRTFGSLPPEGAVSPGNLRREPLPKDEFDIGEVMQSVGDSLGGVAAEAEVDLVLHHGDAIKHMGVKGDECGISYALSHVIHQVLITTRPGDSVEIGLSITDQPRGGDGSDHPSSSSSSGSPANAESSVSNAEGSVVCTFDIAHKFTSSLANEAHSEDSHAEPQSAEVDSEARPEPQFYTVILRRLLKHIGGILRPSLQPTLFPTGRRCELTFILECGPSLTAIHQRTPPADDELHHYPFSGVRLAREPSIDELTSFAETLRGKRVAFHASSKGSFAHHLTRYLTAWGLDISHVPTDGLEEMVPAQDIYGTHVQSGYTTTIPTHGVELGIPTGDNIPPIVDNASDTASENKPVSSGAGLSLIIIDDDVLALRRRLLQHRAEVVPNLHLHPRKRPSLAVHHRPRSSPSIRKPLLGTSGQQQMSPPSAFSPVPIVHFTSLANYKLVKDAIQAVIIVAGSMPFLPEVIVIPKPAGPRRILTALHTAIHKPMIDPFFSPIATSPMSPGGSISPFMTGRKSTSGLTPPFGSRNGSERIARSGSESATTIPPPSPLSIPEGLEYFSDAAVKQLGGNPASGLVIQSPDGRPAGIFFQPQSRFSSSSSRGDLTTTTSESERFVPRPGSARRSNARKTNTDGRTESAEPFKGTPGHESVPAKPTITLPANMLSFSPTVTPCLEQPRFGAQTDLLRTYKGKGRAGVSAEKEETHTLASVAWREATQYLAKQPLTPVTPLESNPNSAVSMSETQSHTSDTSLIAPTRKTSSAGIQAPIPRSSTSTSPEPKKSVARRATQVSKSPITSTTMKKSKTFGNNIVPPISVLIVEDNAINQTILSTFMRRNKIKYEVAWNGREAVEKWRGGNFHLILMDIQMPVMDGIEATKEIRRLEKTENIGHFPPSPGESSRRSADGPDSRPSSAASTPFRSQVIIVALTASSLQSDRVAALAAGCNDFLTKPVTNSWLNDKIIEWGSIKALQMWAELRPEVSRNLGPNLAAQAQAVASKLHVPPDSVRGSPLKGTYSPLSDAVDSRAAEDKEDVNRISRKARHSGAKTTQRSDKNSSSSDSSPERWPMSSDDDDIQDPITEPPAVIATPVHSVIELPELDNEPIEVTGEDALLQFLEESQDPQMRRPTLLGQRAISSVTSSTSIASVLHETPGIGGTETDGFAAAINSRENNSHETPTEKNP